LSSGNPEVSESPELIALLAQEQSRIKEAERKRKEAEMWERQERLQRLQKHEEERERQEKELKIHIEKQRSLEEGDAMRASSKFSLGNKSLTKSQPIARRSASSRRERSGSVNGSAEHHKKGPRLLTRYSKPLPLPINTPEDAQTGNYLPPHEGEVENQRLPKPSDPKLEVEGERDRFLPELNKGRTTSPVDGQEGASTRSGDNLLHPQPLRSTKLDDLYRKLPSGIIKRIPQPVPKYLTTAEAMEAASKLSGVRSGGANSGLIS
jgi:hypothetical protein